MLRKLVMDNPELRAYLILKGPSSFTSLKDAIEEYVRNSETFTPPGSPGQMNAVQPIPINLEVYTGRPAGSSHLIEQVKDEVR